MTSWLTLAEAKAFLRKDAGATADDLTLQMFVDGACEAVERVKGHVTPTPVVEDHQCGRGGVVVVDERPVLAVQSVTILRGGDEADTLDRFDPASGTRGWVEHSEGVFEVPAATGTWVRVLYTAGVDQIPTRWQQAALELVRHANRLWTTNTARRGSGDAAEYIPGATSAMPNRVRELLDLWGKHMTDEVLFA